MPETTWNWTLARANAFEISGTEQAEQLASHSPVSVCLVVERAAGWRFKTSTGTLARWTTGSTWDDVA